MPGIQINLNDAGRGSILVDGQELRRVTGLTFTATGGVPHLAVTLDVFGGCDVATADGALTVTTDQPEAVERALLAYLLAKYPAAR